VVSVIVYDKDGSFVRAWGEQEFTPRTHGITVGIDTIARQSKAAALVLWGRDKHLAFERVANTEDYDVSWPASVIAVCREGEILADRAAERGGA